MSEKEIFLAISQSLVGSRSTSLVSVPSPQQMEPKILASTNP